MKPTMLEGLVGKCSPRGRNPLFAEFICFAQAAEPCSLSPLDWDRSKEQSGSCLGGKPSGSSSAGGPSWPFAPEWV